MDLVSLRSKYGTRAQDSLNGPGRPGLSEEALRIKEQRRGALGEWIRSLRIRLDPDKVEQDLKASGLTDIEKAFQAERGRKSTPNGRIALSLASAYGIPPREIACKILEINDPALLACMMHPDVITPEDAKTIIDEIEVIS